MESLYKSIGSWRGDFTQPMFDIVKGQKEFVGMIRTSFKFGPPIRKDDADRDIVFMVKGKHAVIEKIHGGYRFFGVVKLPKGY